MVSVPEAGGLVNLTVPVTLNKPFEHGPGNAVIRLQFVDPLPALDEFV